MAIPSSSVFKLVSKNWALFLSPWVTFSYRSCENYLPFRYLQRKYSDLAVYIILRDDRLLHTSNEVFSVLWNSKCFIYVFPVKYSRTVSWWTLSRSIAPRVFFELLDSYMRDIQGLNCNLSRNYNLTWQLLSGGHGNCFIYSWASADPFHRAARSVDLNILGR